ncbi:YceI family protein [Mucilaginibacter sp. BT774]|uniref:YceI family protein n=1 Tax=Mucilaginibacter sp. BT774 TaxID=3062276 RepID=UPI002675BAFB|nr:YceI family protein [Mucilaginibacter sp. BT774]MDO3624763.1 YceI family protein [Mucilaginibacter sp. BT774]
MKHILIILLAWVTVHQAGQDIYVCKNVKVNLFSSAPIEDIEANTTTGVSVYNPGTGELEFSIPIRSFHFPKALMEEHFNENYIESDKFPKATFKGKIQERIDVSKDGTYPVTVTGDFQVHGVTQPRTITGNLKVSGGVVTMTSEFMVKCADHHIDIPQIVFHHIAESIRIRVSATYTTLKNNNPSK